MPQPNPEFAEAVLDVVAGIPEGLAMAYGDVAAAIGSRAPRAVGAVMAYYGGDVPWWRVVRASGHPVSRRWWMSVPGAAGLVGLRYAPRSVALLEPCH